MSRANYRRHACSFLLGGSLAACNVGPDYQRPEVKTPASFRGTAAPTANAAPAASFAEERWSVVFQDEVLQGLVQTALANNHDLAIAANRVLQAEAEYGIVHADQLPTLNAQAGAQIQRGRLRSADPQTVGGYQLGASLSWELDFWGKFRRASEDARARILGAEWARRAVVTSLVSGVATSYFQLRALDRQLEIAERTLETRKESLRLTEIRDRGGAGSLVDIRLAEQLVEGAGAQIVLIKGDIEQLENAISFLTGQHPGAVARGRSLSDEPRAPEVPAGLPSALLERRPDIVVAEQGMVAANASIGQAKAQYFPQLDLTASGGVLNPTLGTLFSAPAIVWSAAASAVQPIFNGGRIDSQVRAAELAKEESVLNYRRTILQALREVSDALVGYRSQRELREIRARLVTSAKDARRLADMRYRGGNSSYFEVLDSDTRLFVAELDYVQAELAELSAFVEIYRALGGGWQG